MSNDTQYKLKFSHESFEYMGDVLKYLEEKFDRWEDAKKKGQKARDLLKEHGLKKANEVVSWGFNVERVTVCLSAWANENTTNLPISGENGELADLLQKFPELEIDGKYEDEYTYGSIDGADKCERGNVKDLDDDEGDEDDDSA